jgi:predicted nucleotidyltransferase
MACAIAIDRNALEAFCRRHGIAKLSLFGSVLREDFRPESDVDVLVRFAPGNHRSLFDLMHMADELGAILGRNVDLVEEEGLVNPFRRRNILRSSEAIYNA